MFTNNRRYCWAATVRAARAVLLVSLVTLSSPAHAQASVSQQQFVAASRVAKNSWQFTYQVTVTNGPLALNAVTIVAADPSPNGIVAQNSVNIGNLAANAIATATVSFQATGNQPAANGDYHDSFWTSYLASLMFEVIPGPGPVAQVQISSTQGGAISVTGAGNPLNGTQVLIPAGALGDPTATITVGYSNSLPAPLDPDAAAVGITPVSPATLTLTKTGATALQSVVTVTMPYSARLLGPNDYPAVTYWDDDVLQYQAVQVVDVNQTAGTVTFVTKHFTSFVVIGLKGLGDMLLGAVLFPDGLQSVNSGFLPQTDGFEIETFGTQAADASNGNKGVCFGLTSYAAWFYSKHPAGAGSGLFGFYSTPSDNGDPHIAQEDALARELVAQVFADTLGDNVSWGQLSFLQGDLRNAQQFILNIKTSHAPQLAGLTGPASNHSVLVYAFDASSGNFFIYDPNAPVPQTQPTPLHFTLGSGFTVPWSGFTRVFFDARGSHYDRAVLDALFTRAQAGPPNPNGQWRFNDLAVRFPQLPTKLGEYPNPSSFSVDQTTSTPVTVTWTCSLCAPSASQPQAYLHMYQDGLPVSVQSIVSGEPTTVFTPSFKKATSEVLWLVSLYQGIPPFNPATGQIDPTNSSSQSDTIPGYAAFRRVELVAAIPAPTVTTLTANPTSLPSSGGALLLTASVASSPGTGNGAAFIGSVTFTDQSGATLCQAVPVIGSAASCSSSIAVAPDTITARYSGDLNYSPSTATITITAANLGHAIVNATFLYQPISGDIAGGVGHFTLDLTTNTVTEADLVNTTNDLQHPGTFNYNNSVGSVTYNQTSGQLSIATGFKYATDPAFFQQQFRAYGTAGSYSGITATIDFPNVPVSNGPVILTLSGALALRIAPTSPSVNVGATLPLTMTATLAGQPVAPPALQWSSSNTATVTVDSTGTVTGVGVGVALVTATDPASGVTDEVEVTVTSPWVGTWAGTRSYLVCNPTSGASGPWTVIITTTGGAGLLINGDIFTVSGDTATNTNGSVGTSLPNTYVLSGNTMTYSGGVNDCLTGTLTRQ